MSHDHTLAREAALKALYQVDLHKASSPDEVRKLVDASVDEVHEHGSSRGAVRRYARRLSLGVLDHRSELDELIRGVAQNWNLERMAVIDRNIIRIGAFEILHEPELPRAVAINEAIELARKYSTQESGGFVNGILDQMGTGGASTHAAS